MAIEIPAENVTTADRGVTRSIYVATATLFIVVALVGFGTFSDRRPMPPPIVHVHGALMVAWLTLFFAQAVLIGSGRRQLHQRLGITSFLLAPAMLVGMFFVTAWSFRDSVSAGYPEPASKFLLVQIKDFLLFAGFWAWAILARRTAPETHKRAMVLATFVLMNAATGRIAWLPGNFQPNLSYDLAPWYPLLLLVPALIHDVVRRRNVHRAYVVGIGLYVALALVIGFLWDSPWWLRTAPTLLSAT